VGVPFSQSYVGITSSQVQETIHRTVEVIDGGVPGYTSYQGLQLLQTDILPLRPDVVTLYFGTWNDYTPAVGADDSEKGQNLANARSFEVARRMVSTLRVFMLTQQAIARFNAWRDSDFEKPGINEYIDSFREGRPLEGRRVSPEKFETNLTAMVRLSRSNGITPILITPPLTRKSRNDFPIYETYRAIVAKVAKQENVTLVDAAGEMARIEAEGESLYVDWAHPNAKGHKIIADLLSPELARLLSGKAGS
jgi:lysophospholipase L1-like esterase